MATTKMVGASHTIRVKTLYRHALKNLQNWTVWREMFIEKGFELRAQFDAQKKLTDPKMIEEVVSKAEAKLAELKHPDPYTSARRLHPHHKRARTTAAFLLFSPQKGSRSLRAHALCLWPSSCAVPTMPGGSKYQRHPFNSTGFPPEVSDAFIEAPVRTPLCDPSRLSLTRTLPSPFRQITRIPSWIK